MKELYSIAPNSWSQIESASAHISKVLDARASQALYGVYSLNLYFSLFYLIFGMVIVSLLRMRGLKKQILVLKALGADNRSIYVPLIVDTSISILLSLIFGTFLALILTNFIIQFPLMYYQTETATQWTRLPILLQIPAALLVGIVGFSFLFSIWVSYVSSIRTLRKNIAEELQFLE
jgi:ABC-type antimicrobial peptide transport system permease subunit